MGNTKLKPEGKKGSSFSLWWQWRFLVLHCGM